MSIRHNVFTEMFFLKCLRRISAYTHDETSFYILVNTYKNALTFGGVKETLGHKLRQKPNSNGVQLESPFLEIS